HTAPTLAHALINRLLLPTRHDSHERLVRQALITGKHVFVEKPLALTLDDLAEIESAFSQRKEPQVLMVGFNRRFAPQVQKIKSLLSAVNEPKAFVMTVNAGEVPLEHWTQNLDVGGGRIVGEACHFIDLLRFLTGSRIIKFDALAIGKLPGIAVVEDKVSITLSFEDGSLGTIVYLAN